MLAIRMQRTGRKGHAQFRVVVQDSRWSPKSGKYVALLGSYNPHTKTTTLVKDKAQEYVNHGAQPSDLVARLFKSEGVKLPNWVQLEGKKQGKLRNPEKLRRNRPAEAKAPETPPAAEVEPKDQETEAAEPASAAAEPAADKRTEPEAQTEAPAHEAEVDLPAPESES